jgi:myo-inositol-1(or 4)-monophosphatase
MDGFWEQDLKPWDVAAGALIVAESGGLVTNWKGEAFSSRSAEVLASNGRLHDAMLGLIHEYRNRRRES